jgi:hypothetical protein
MGQPMSSRSKSVVYTAAVILAAVSVWNFGLF